jgi:hypothetical protein
MTILGAATWSLAISKHTSKKLLSAKMAQGLPVEGCLYMSDENCSGPTLLMDTWLSCEN